MVHVPTKLKKKVEWLFRRAEGALLPEDVLDGEGAHLDPDGARLALRAMVDDLAIVGAEARYEALLRAEGDLRARRAYVAAHGVVGVRRFDAARTRIYCLEVETLPKHVNNIYLLREPGSSLLFDVGSGLPTSRRDLALAFAVLRAVFEEDVRWEELDTCVVSHAHADHFGGVSHLRETSRAELLVHELDAPVITDLEERLGAAARALDGFWRSGGVPDRERATMGELYESGKRLFRAARVDRVLRDGDTVGPGYRVHHVPGHCPGLICLQVHDVLLTSDHVLARITPHQFPRAIAPFAGLAHYFESLGKIRRLEGIRLALGGHEEPIVDLYARIDAIERFHRRRLARVEEICGDPRTVHEVALAMFGEQEGYGVILALDEAGAHVEYLVDQGRLRVEEPAPGTRSKDGGGVRYVTNA